jgi:hypothetical protein
MLDYRVINELAGEVIVRVFYYVGNQIKKNAKPKDGSLEGVGEELHIASDSEFISLHDLESVELVQTKDFGLLVRAQAATSTVWFNVPRVFNMGGKPITINNPDATRRAAEILEPYVVA